MFTSLRHGQPRLALAIYIILSWLLIWQKKTLLACHPTSIAFLSLARFQPTLERLCTNRVRLLLRMRSMLLGFYSSEPRPNSRALGTVCSVMTIGLSLNRCSQSKKKFDERKQDYLVQKFGLRRLQIQSPFLIRDKKDDKKRLFSQGRPGYVRVCHLIFWIVNSRFVDALLFRTPR